MVIMGRWLKSILFFVVVALLITPVFSHPGRTDANGGHYDRSTGEYHYHNGSSAGKKSSSSSTVATLPPVLPAPTFYNTYDKAYGAELRDNVIEPTYKNGSVIKLFAIIFLVLIIVYLYNSKNDIKISFMNYKINSEEKTKIELDGKDKEIETLSETNRELRATIDSLKKNIVGLADDCNRSMERNAELTKETSELKSLIANIGALVGSDTVEEAKSEPEIVIPVGVTLHNGIPVKGCPTNDKPFGDYTVYVSSKSYVYHANTTCSCSWKSPKHLYSLSPSYRKCLRCYPPDLPAAEDREWYFDILSATKKIGLNNGINIPNTPVASYYSNTYPRETRP